MPEIKSFIRNIAGVNRNGFDAMAEILGLVVQKMDSAIHQAPLVQTLDSAIQRISIREINCVVQWIVIDPVDGTIHLLNNWRPFSNHYTIKWIVLTANMKEAVSNEKCESYRKQVVHPQALEEETTG